MNEGEQGSKKASYGMNLHELSVFHQNQSLNSIELVDAVNSIEQTGSREHELIEKIALGYKVPKIEYKEVYHVILDNPLFDEGSGQRIDRGPVVQKFSKAAFALSENNGGFMAKLSVILHDPIKAKELIGNPQIVNGDIEESEKEKKEAEELSVLAEIKAEELASENAKLRSLLEEANNKSNPIDMGKDANKEDVSEDELDKYLEEEEKGKQAEELSKGGENV